MNPILVVDDNAQIVDILSQYIKKEGWPMLAAKTGEEALALFDAAEPSLILLDIMLPGLDGLEVCRRIRRVSSTRIGFSGWTSARTITSSSRFPPAR